MLGAFIKTAADRPAAHICGHDGIGRHASFRFSCFTALGFESPCPHHVAADDISFAATFLQKSPLTHFVAAPFQTGPAAQPLATSPPDDGALRMRRAPCGYYAGLRFGSAAARRLCLPLKNIDFSRPFHTNIIRTCFR